MLCEICSTPHKNKRFCSGKCKDIWFINKNITDNPIRNPESLERMRVSLTGKKQSETTKAKRSRKLASYYANNPEAKERLRKNVWDKYTSKIAGSGWPKISKKIRERDNYACQHCGETKKRLIVHHLDWRGKRRGVPSSEWNNNPSNLVTLCDKCHNGIHRHKANDYNERKAIMQNNKENIYGS